MSVWKAAGALLVVLACTGCQTPQTVILSTKSSVELRAMQTRAFDTSDRPKMVRTIIATLQDLGYNLDKVDAGIQAPYRRPSSRPCSLPPASIRAAKLS